MKYGSSVTSCPRSCTTPDAHTNCKLANIEGCQCKSGYVLSGKQCVPTSQCGCVDSNGIYHKVGEAKPELLDFHKSLFAKIYICLKKI